MIAIIDYGLGNLRSVQKAFAFVGLDAEITSDKNIIRSASHMVLPGVGAFGSGMKQLTETGLAEETLKGIQAGKPLLGICLGMQLLFGESFEYGHHQGLNIIPGSIVPLPEGQKVPHMGWNNLMIQDNPLFTGLAQGPYVYFVHSFYAQCADEYIIGRSEYGISFAAAVNRENVYGTQFHPEKSGDSGLIMLKNFGGLR